MELHLIRHPKPDIPPGTCYGQSDIGLLEPVEAAAQRLRPLLPADFALHASPLARARLLAEALGQPAIDARLKEMHFGTWELQRFDQIGDALAGWSADPLGFRAPDGESVQDMAERVRQWLDDTLAAARQHAEAANRPVVIVAHGGPLRVIAGHLLGIPPQRWLGLDFACAQSTRIDCESWGNTLKWFNR